MSNPNASIGKIMANINSKPFTAAGGNRFPRGQCTNWCAGEASRKYHINLCALLPAPANGGDWYDKIITTDKVTKRPAAETPVTDSVASFAHNTWGHVVFIECVKDGFVYFTEYNWKLAQNGRLQKIPVGEFPTLHGCKLNGYIVIR